jgi:undecaprenyl diphosphate synthase
MAKYKRIPSHIGIIPDGNRRWAVARGLDKRDGYFHGIGPAKKAFRDVWDAGIREVSVYIFTKENSHRPADQVQAFKQAFFDFLGWVRDQDVSLLVIGDTSSKQFPRELVPLTIPDSDRQRKRKLNFLVNYNFEWDIKAGLKPGNGGGNGGNVLARIGSRHVSRVDLLIRWGDRQRLSGFLPLQTAYADIYIVKDLWPDYRSSHLHDALKWYNAQDITLGG